MKKKIIGGVIAIIIIVAAVMGILYFTTDMFKTPEQLFYKHLADDMNFLGKTSYQDVMKEVKNKKEASRESSGEVTAKITSTDASTNQVGAALEKGKITYNAKTIGAEEKMQGDFTLHYDGKDIVTLNVLQNKNQYGIKIADVYEKYISVENNNLKALFQKLGVDATNIPDKIEALDYYKLLEIEEATLKHIEETYTNIIKENIPAESFTVEKNVVANIDGTDVTTNAYKLTLTEAQTKTVLEKLIETLKADDVTLDLIISKYNMIFEPYKAMGMQMSGTTELTKEMLITALEDELESLKSMTAGDTTMLEIIAYGIKDSKTKVVLNAIENDEAVASIQMDMTKVNAENKAVMTMNVDDDVITVQTIENDKNMQVEVRLAADDTTMTIKANQNGEKSSEISIAITSDGTTIELMAKDEVKDTTIVAVEDFTKDNSVKLNDMTQNEIVTLIQTVAASVQNVLPQKAQLLGISL